MHRIGIIATQESRAKKQNPLTTPSNKMNWLTSTKNWLTSLFRKLRKWGQTKASAAEEFQRFKVVYGMLPSVPEVFVNREVLTELLSKDAEKVSLTDLQAGYLALVELMPEEMLRTRFGSLVEEYETVTRNKLFAHGAVTLPPTTVEGWRAGVASLMEDLVKFRSAKRGFERVHSVLGMAFGLILIVFVLAGFVYADFSFGTTPPQPATWPPVLFCGMAGAGFSVLIRLHSLNWSPKIAAHFEDLEALRRGLLIDCVLSIARGAFAAGIVYLLFASGLLKGELFPHFAPFPVTLAEPTAPTLNALESFYVSHLATPGDVAKLLIWVFIAGFAERFVPDKLNRLAGEASATNERK